MQKYWSRLLFPSPGDLLDPRTEPGSPALQVVSLFFFFLCNCKWDCFLNFSVSLSIVYRNAAYFYILISYSSS